MIQDPTTAWDFMRRFTEAEVLTLMEAINAIRSQLWTGRGVGQLGPITVDTKEIERYAEGLGKEAEAFSGRIYGEAVRRGIESAEKVCVLGDGAPWIWHIAEEQFYGTRQIVDLYHAREHYWKVAKMVFGRDKETMKPWAGKRRQKLNRGEVEQVMEAIGQLPIFTNEEKESLVREIHYFDNNKARMRYAEDREQGPFVGSGA